MPSSQPIGTKPSPLALLTKLASKRSKTAAVTGLTDGVDPAVASGLNASGLNMDSANAMYSRHPEALDAIGNGATRVLNAGGKAVGLGAGLAARGTGAVLDHPVAAGVAGGLGLAGLGVGAVMLLHHLLKRQTKRAKTAGVWSDAREGFSSLGRAAGGALDATGSAITKTPVLKSLATGGAAGAGLANAAGRLITRSTAGAPASSTATRLADPTGAVKGATSLSTPPSTTAPAVAPSESAAMGVVNRGADAVKGGLDAAGSKLGVPAAAMGVVNRGADDVKKGIDTVGGTIAAHPLASAGVAAGAGAILGLLLSRKSKKDEPAPPAARYAPI